MRVTYSNFIHRLTHFVEALDQLPSDQKGSKDQNHILRQDSGEQLVRQLEYLLEKEEQLSRNAIRAVEIAQIEEEHKALSE
jgi:hypothetical protein